MSEISNKTANAVESIIAELEGERRKSLIDNKDTLDEEKVKELVAAFYKDHGLTIDESKIDFLIQNFKKDNLPVVVNEVKNSSGSLLKNILFKFKSPNIFTCIFKEKWNRDLERLLWEHKPYSLEDIEDSYQANLSKMKFWKFKMAILFAFLATYFVAIFVLLGLFPSKELVFVIMASFITVFFFKNWFKKVINDWKLMNIQGVRQNIAKHLLMVPLYRHLFKHYSTDGGGSSIDVLDRFNDMFELFNKCNWKNISPYNYNFVTNKNANKIIQHWEERSNDNKVIKNIDCFLLNQYCLNQLEKSNECKIYRKEWVDLDA